MKTALILAAAGLAATFAGTLGASTTAPSTERDINGRALTAVEAIRYGRSERSAPNWDRVEPRSASQGSSQAPSKR
jgi:hypothetical protein